MQIQYLFSFVTHLTNIALEADVFVGVHFSDVLRQAASSVHFVTVAAASFWVGVRGSLPRELGSGAL